MATFKLPAGGRQRTARACIPCRTAKKRCIGGIPCAYCVHHGRAALCTLGDDGKSTGDRGPRAGISLSAARNRSISHHPIIASPENASAVASISINNSAVDHDLGNPLAESVDIQSPETTMSSVPPRLLRNSKGNKVYVGSSAIISFLPLLRSVFKRSLGASAFTEQSSHGVMLESDSTLDGQMPVQETTTLSQKSDLVKLFFAATSGVLDIVEPSVILEALRAEDAGHSVDPFRSAFASLAVAIGAQCHPDAIAYRICEVAHFERAKPFLTIEKLGDPSLDTVRLFVLAAFYMLCACNRNMGYMYLGIAARASHVLGLHHVGLFPDLADAERHARIRLWKSLRVFETLVSSFLGRPAATQHPYQEHGEVRQATSSSTAPRALSVDTICGLLEIVDDVLDNIYRKNTIDIVLAKASIDRLTNWSTSLPQSLQSASDQSTFAYSYQEDATGNMHVACSYYFAIMLVTRPFLIYHYLHEQPQTHQTPFADMEPEAIPTTMATQDVLMLAKSCEDAAVFMVTACHDALERDAVLDNMCLIQAFLFAAALVLGLVMFTDKDSDRDVARSLKNALAVMKKLSQRSRQAEHYLWILRDMLKDIETFQDQIATRRRESSRRPVKSLFQTTRGDNRNSQGAADPLAVSRLDWRPYQTMSAEGTPTSTLVFPPPTTGPTSVENGIASLDFLSIQFWDDFPALGPG